MQATSTRTPRGTDADEATELPDDLETAQAKLCYYALAGEGPSTLGDLEASLDLGKLTLLDVLGTMVDDGHVERGDRGRYAIS